MCLIAIAHRVSARFPLVIAANRDEDYDRPSHDAHFWPDAPAILGGRDAVHGGTWLALTRKGRFAAVTNLQGAERREKSRGALVRDFVGGSGEPRTYAQAVLRDAASYAGFHLFAGEMRGELVHVTPEGENVLAPGIHAVSNAPLGVRWPKVDAAVAEMELALRMDDATSMMLVLLQFLAAPRGTQNVESEVFIAGERYGTRASTVIVAGEKEIFFGEQSFTRGGVPYAKSRLFRIEIES